MESSQEILGKKQLVEFWKGRFNFSGTVINAFKKIKRGDFVAGSLRQAAYNDMPLPLIRGKTISQPTTVMLMTSALELKKGERVFEIGTGSGYQSAIISQIVGPKGEVISTEVVPELVQFAKQNLQKAGIKNVFVYEEDGSKGMQSKAPFDKIIITAACKEFPKELVNQLKTGGIIVGPVGNLHEQEMIGGVKDRNGKLELEFLGQFLFTPMYGRYGFEYD
ncbi:MAG TPA: protein-L-isoaspartate(D-aspartate) O-methyltransferase [Candidatus Nanoarchaeia archaeon]|nr:protein-L-isoaspartate(D-aspartate) O-methyltransferase [Candidatus Nanoarchaeia archaeon]